MAISLQRIVVSALILTSIVSVLNLTPSQLAYATATFTIDSTGGDCNTIGVWDASKRQCTLKFNVLGSIVIAADGITLDGARHTLTGDGTGNGVLLSGRTGVTVKNVIVKNFEVGIFLSNSDGNTLTSNTANSNTGDGISLEGSDGNTLKNNTANSNVNEGILLNLSNGNTLTSNTANSNGFGILLNLSNGNTLTSNTANSNSFGIFVQLSNSNTLTGNTANSNAQSGIFLNISNGNTLTSNTANSNSFGILIIGSNNVLQRNTASLNIQSGFLLNTDTNTTLKGNTANSNGAFGYKSVSSTGLIFSKNKCSGNGSGGSDPTGLCLPQP